MSHLILKPSLIPQAGLGLFTNKFIHPNTPVVLYHGKKLSQQEVYQLNQDLPEAEFKELNSRIRGTVHDYVILGPTQQQQSTPQPTNPYHLGVYVNDISRIQIDHKDQLTEQHLKDYVQTLKRCNLRVSDDPSSEYPVYYATRRIKKNEELYVHYGIGFWLLQLGFRPLEISELNRKHPFDLFY